MEPGSDLAIAQRRVMLKVFTRRYLEAGLGEMTTL